MKRLALTLALCVAPLPALAHKVIAAVFPSGDAIEGEIGFSNGDMAVDQEITVTGPEGAELGRIRTDQDGFFLFRPTEPVAHTFSADLGAGHVAETTMPADEVAAILGHALPTGTAAAAAAPPAPATAGAAPAITVASLQTILGGIGYIAGLFGLGFYIAARRRLGA